MALRPQNWRQKNRLNLLGGFSIGLHAQQPICRSAHLLIIGIDLITVKHRFDFSFESFAGLRTIFIHIRSRLEICQGLRNPRLAGVSAKVFSNDAQQFIHQAVILFRVIALDHHPQKRLCSRISNDQSAATVQRVLDLAHLRLDCR